MNWWPWIPRQVSMYTGSNTVVVREPEGIEWRRVNTEPFEYAIQQGPHGDEFVKLLNGTHLRRAVAPLTAHQQCEGI